MILLARLALLALTIRAGRDALNGSWGLLIIILTSLLIVGVVRTTPTGKGHEDTDQNS